MNPWPDEFAEIAEDEGWNIFEAQRDVPAPSGFEIERDDEFRWFKNDTAARDHVRRMFFWTGREIYRRALELDAATWGLEPPEPWI
jgi:hypothetical protein